jgi:hypothetical protein
VVERAFAGRWNESQVVSGEVETLILLLQLQLTAGAILVYVVYEESERLNVRTGVALFVNGAHNLVKLFICRKLALHRSGVCVCECE